MTNSENRQSVSIPAPTAPCRWCGHDVTCHWWQNENDPGDRGWVRDCLHGDYATTDIVGY